MTTYTSIGRLPLMTPGDPAVKDAWGSIINAALQQIDQLAAGNGPIDLTGYTAYTLTVANNAPDQARQAMLPFGGSPTGDCTVTLPPVARIGWVANNTSGNHNVILTAGGAISLTVAAGAAFLYSCDGANVSAVSIGGSGVLTAALGVLINNNAVYQAKDTNGNPQALAKIGADNWSDFYLGASGYRLVTQNGATTLLSILPSGAATFGNSLTVGGPLVINGTSSLQGATNINGDLAVTGAIGGQAITGTSLAVTGNINGGALGVSGGVTAGTGFLMPNAVFVSGRDTGAVARQLIGIGADNYTNLFMGGTAGWRVLNQSGSQTLFNISNTGAASFIGSLMCSGGFGAQAITGTSINVGAGNINGGALGVTGAINGASLGVSGNVTAGGVIATNAAFSGNVSGVSGSLGTLSTTGAVTLGGLLTLSGNSATSGTGCFFNAPAFSAGPAAWSAGIALTASGGLLAGGFYTNSDARLKTQVTDIAWEEAEAWVHNGRPRHYIMDNHPQAGFLAQEDLTNGRSAAIIGVPDPSPIFAEGDGQAPPGIRLTRNYEHDIAYLTAALQSALTRIALLEAAV